MSLIGRLADAAETAASATTSGTPMGRTAVALESIGGTTRATLSYPQRIALASQDINGGTPITDGSPFVNAADNLEAAASVSNDASPIERMIIACEAGFAP